MDKPFIRPWWFPNNMYTVHQSAVMGRWIDPSDFKSQSRLHEQTKQQCSWGLYWAFSHQGQVCLSWLTLWAVWMVLSGAPDCYGALTNLKLYITWLKKRLIFLCQKRGQSQRKIRNNILPKKCWNKSWGNHCELKLHFGSQMARHEFNGYTSYLDRLEYD